MADEIECLGVKLPAPEQHSIRDGPLSFSPQVLALTRHQSALTGIVLTTLPENGINHTKSFAARRGSVISIGRVPAGASAPVNSFPEAPQSCAVLSRKHAKITCPDHENAFLTDLGSHHGTTIQRGELATFKLDPELPYILCDGDTITFGKSVTHGGEVHEPLVVRVKLQRAPYLNPVNRQSLSTSGRFGLDDDEEDEDEEDDDLSEPERQDSPDIIEIPPPPGAWPALPFELPPSPMVFPSQPDLRKEVADLRTALNSAQDEIAQLKRQSAETTLKEFADLQEKVADLKAAIEPLIERNDALEQDEADVRSEMEGVVGRIEDLKCEIANAEDDAEDAMEDVRMWRDEAERAIESEVEAVRVAKDRALQTLENPNPLKRKQQSEEPSSEESDSTTAPPTPEAPKEEPLPQPPPRPSKRFKGDVAVAGALGAIATWAALSSW